jgi:hypothetical protein
MKSHEISNPNRSSHTKKRIHRLAISSLVLGVVGVFLPYLFWYIGFGLCWRDEWIAMLFAQILATFSLISFIGSGGISIALGTIALVQIKRSSGAFSGIGFSIAGIISGTGTLVIFSGVAESLFWIYKGVSELFA